MIWGGMPLSHEPDCPAVITKGIIPKRAFPTSDFAPSALALLLLLPAVKLLLKIPPCTALSPILHARRCSALILRRWLQQMPLPASGSPSRFCLPRNFKVHYAPQYTG